MTLLPLPLRGGAPSLEFGWFWDLPKPGECGRNQVVWLLVSGLRKFSSFPFCLLMNQMLCKEAQARLLYEKRGRVTCPSSKYCNWGARHGSIAVLNILAPVDHLTLCSYSSDPSWRFHAADEPPYWAQPRITSNNKSIFKAIMFWEVVSYIAIDSWYICFTPIGDNTTFKTRIAGRTTKKHAYQLESRMYAKSWLLHLELSLL